jgi:hypothetical protein
MNHGPNYVYTDAMNQCGHCDAHVAAAHAIGIYIVGKRGAIRYPLCKRYAMAVRKGLALDQQRKVDRKMEKRAAELGLTQTQ